MFHQPFFEVRDAAAIITAAASVTAMLRRGGFALGAAAAFPPPGRGAPRPSRSECGGANPVRAPTRIPSAVKRRIDALRDRTRQHGPTGIRGTSRKFHVFKGGDVREQFGVNQWLEQRRIVASLDLAKRDDVLPGLRQAHWDLVIVDEAHRMSARDETHKSQRYRLGELLRDSADHILLLTATPHKGDPQSFTRFLQLLDRDAYADVRSIRKAMERQWAPFYLRRTKEAMLHFPERRADGRWAARPVFTKRIPRTASFAIDGAELDLYREVTQFVKRQSRRAAEREDDPRARAVGFLTSLYQRRPASSARAMRRSLPINASSSSPSSPTPSAT